LRGIKMIVAFAFLGAAVAAIIGTAVLMCNDKPGKRPYRNSYNTRHPQ
jgi:hypothetical protein